MEKYERAVAEFEGAELGDLMRRGAPEDRPCRPARAPRHRRRRRRRERRLPPGATGLERRRRARAARAHRGHDLALGRLRRPAALDDQPDADDHVLDRALRASSPRDRARPGLARRRRPARRDDARAGRGAAPPGERGDDLRAGAGPAHARADRERLPLLEVDDVLASAWLPGDGYLDPELLGRRWPRARAAAACASTAHARHRLRGSTAVAYRRPHRPRHDRHRAS